MATKKTTKKAAAKKSSPVKKKTTKATTTKKTLTKVTTKKLVTNNKPFGAKLPKNLINIVLAELVGTFVLTLVALFSAFFMGSFYVGLALMVIVLSIGAISGAHINPAVTFGLWTMRKVKTALMLFYWAAQLLGSMAAVVLLGSLSDNQFVIHFDHFTAFSWGIFFVELIGMAVFMFGVAAAVTKLDAKPVTKAFGIGMSLTIGLIVASTLGGYVQAAEANKYQEKMLKQTTAKIADKKEGERTYPRELYITGSTLNPAVALAVTEKTDSQLQSNSVVAQKDEKSYSRFGIEVILATLIGAALGGNLFLLVNYRSQEV
ncbi:hypothetical protein CR969_03355 [Candidatus Saccharibacteria bacterium]|nr:MAG: hypothetical protein CR969_03355 [Candidatus Saccharibacteria bacterium]